MLTEFCQENKQTPFSNNTRDSSTHGCYQMVNTKIRLITFFAAKNGEALYTVRKQTNKQTHTQKRPGADYGSDHELLIAQFRLHLKKVEKTTRPFRYDLNQIPYDYKVEVTNRFKGLDVAGRVPEEL